MKYGKLYDIQTKIEDEGLWDVSESKQMNAVYKGLVGSLNDKYSEYYTPSEAKEWDNYVNATFYGIGVIFTQDEKNRFLISDVIDQSPADNAGLKKGDIITQVNGKTYKTSDKLKDAIRGELGTKVNVTYERNGVSKTVTITRGKVTETTVSGTILKDHMAYIRISSFAEKTAEEFQHELSTLEKKDPKGLIIDLRENPGGYADQALKIADQLLPECTITYLQDRKGKKTYYNSKESATKLKYVLLVDGGSASSSEIVAAAVKDNKGGKLVGTRTFGKGIVQQEYQFNDGSELKLTTHQYFSPKGHRINKVGIKPDYTVKFDISGDHDAQLEKAMQLLEAD